MNEKEIEKKFLIKSLPGDLKQYQKIHVVQGYLNASGRPSLRVRKYGEEYILSYKFKEKTQKETANVAREVELPLVEESFEHLMKKIDGRVVEKNRYLIPLQDGLVAELDVFEGYLDGLKFVEVEFKSEEDAANFNPPEWFGRDVTFDVHFKNGYLAKISDVTEILNLIK